MTMALLGAHAGVPICRSTAAGMTPEIRSLASSVATDAVADGGFADRDRWVIRRGRPTKRGGSRAR
jgi:hypothetical protein